LFAAGHSITLLLGVLGGFGVNAGVIDAIIGISIVYKAFENLGGFEELEKVLGFRPDTRMAVFVFGLCHGLGLSTRLQQITLSDDGLIVNLLSFNLGVELGQMLALTVILLLLSPLREAASFDRTAFGANTALMTAGFILAGYHLTGVLL
jgi:hypothetical protein